MLYPKRRAFTLVELLVVIGVIALLISILLPALGKARASAQAVSCGSQLHQISLSFAMYYADYKGYYPALTGNTTTTPSPNFDTVGDLVVVMQEYISKTSLMTNTKTKLWICPSDPRPYDNTAAYDPAASERAVSYYPNEMAWRGALPNDPAGIGEPDPTKNVEYRAIKLSAIHPKNGTLSDVVMIAESLWVGRSSAWYQGFTPNQYQFYNDPLNGFSGRRAPINQDAMVFRHYNNYTASNELYFDGHVGRVNVSECVKSFQSLLTYPDPFIH